MYVVTHSQKVNLHRYVVTQARKVNLLMYVVTQAGGKVNLLMYVVTRKVNTSTYVGGHTSTES